MTSKLTTTADIEKQLALESTSVQMGIARYRETLAKDGLEGLAPGKQLLKAAMQPMVDRLAAWKKETADGLASRNAASYYFLDGIENEAIAWITANCCLGRLHEEPKVVNLATHIAMRLEQTINIDAIAKVNPMLAGKIAKRTAQVTADKNRMVFIRKGAEMVDVKLVVWDDVARVRLGTLLIEMFSQCTGLTTSAVRITGRSTKVTHLRPTESCLKWLEESHARCELLSPVRLPMVCMPRQWTTPFNGGYLTRELQQPLVKTRNKGYLTALKDHQMPWVYASVNALQDTEWSVNKGIYDVIKQLWERGAPAAGLPQRDAVPMPSKSWDDSEGAPQPDPALLNAWKVDAAKAYEANAKLVSKRVQLVQKLWTAEVMLDNGNRFHYVYNLDWRGRIYPIAAALHPQGDDSAKALLCFSRGVPLGDHGAYWLAVHGSNSFGVDKVSFEERIQWVEDNLDMILSSGEQPMEDQRWMDADAPFTFLAFCMEYAKLQRWVDAGFSQETFVSYLPVAFDGSCNGLQNFSAMLRDPVGGKATGLVPGEKPADIYSEVARAAQVIIDRDAASGNETAQRWVGKMTRKLAKRNTMTVPYGVTKRGMRDQLFGELTESQGKQRAEDAEYLSACNYAAIGDVVVAARLAMDWLRDAAKVASSNKLPVRWTTPAGFMAVQDYREEEGLRLDFDVMGRRFQLMIQRTGDSLNVRKQALGISPNYVHSLDAAHLMRTVLHCAADGITDFAMIHDSYGVHAGHAETLRDNLRAAFVEQYSLPVLEQFRDELLTQLPEELQAMLPPLPPMGDLDLEQVKSSEYFFA
jgi:DNA-directed RNA polymerase, mitochondrial